MIDQNPSHDESLGAISLVAGHACGTLADTTRLRAEFAHMLDLLGIIERDLCEWSLEMFNSGASIPSSGISTALASMMIESHQNALHLFCNEFASSSVWWLSFRQALETAVYIEAAIFDQASRQAFNLIASAVTLNRNYIDRSFREHIAAVHPDVLVHNPGSCQTTSPNNVTASLLDARAAIRNRLDMFADFCARR